MKKLQDIFTQPVFGDAETFQTGKPMPMTVMDDFLPVDVVSKMYNEVTSIDDDICRKFTRNGSHMLEFNKLDMTPVAFEVTAYLHSSHALNKLSEITGIKGLIPDPHLVGAGYSKSFTGDTLKVHTDFNWNDTLQLHRALSLIIYLTPDWQPEWHGGLDFYDKERQNVVTHVDCLFNRCLIWQYHKFGWHGHTKPLECPTDKPRTTFRLFYYTSNSTHLPDDPPHRSFYWFDEKTKQPYDKRDHK